jgi:hypothetical protein
MASMPDLDDLPSAGGPFNRCMEQPRHLNGNVCSYMHKEEGQMGFWKYPNLRWRSEWERAPSDEVCREIVHSEMTQWPMRNRR